MDEKSGTDGSSGDSRKELRSVARAVRDLVLIVLGVLLALGADSWRQGRQDRRAELVLLRAMRAALADDLASLEGVVAGFERAEAANLALQDHLTSGGAYTDSLDVLFGRVYALSVPRLNSAAYEALKAAGLQLVRNESLRLEMIELYENAYETVRGQSEFNEGVVFDVLRPYYLSNFRDLRFGQSATPLNYEALRADPLYMNILAYRADFVRRSLINPFERAVGGIKSLSDLLDRELGDT